MHSYIGNQWEQHVSKRVKVWRVLSASSLRTAQHRFTSWLLVVAWPIRHGDFLMRLLCSSQFSNASWCRVKNMCFRTKRHVNVQLLFGGHGQPTTLSPTPTLLRLGREYVSSSVEEGNCFGQYNGTSTFSFKQLPPRIRHTYIR